MTPQQRNRTRSQTRKSVRTSQSTKPTRGRRKRSVAASIPSAQSSPAAVDPSAESPAVGKPRLDDEECIILEAADAKDRVFSWDQLCDKTKDTVMIPLDKLEHDFSVRLLRKADVDQLFEKFKIGLHAVRLGVVSLCLFISGCADDGATHCVVRQGERRVPC